MRVIQLVAVVFLFITSAAWAETRFIYSPNDGFLNLRTGPSTNYPIIRPMFNGDHVWASTSSGKWRKVKHESGLEGWAHGSYLLPLSSMVGGWFYINSPLDGFLNLRWGPSTKNGIIRAMYNGSSVEVLGVSGNWVRVRHDSGAVGWAHSRYLAAAWPPGS